VTDEATMHNQAVYDRIAGLYAERQAGRARSFPDLMASFTGCLPPVADVADLGCGPARDGALLAQAGHRVTGIDRSAGMLALAAQPLPGRTVQADLRSLPLAGESLDGIWCCAALLHVPHGQTMTVLGEMRRVLRRGGHLALVTALGHGSRLETVPYVPDRQRWFFYREAAPLAGQLAAARLRVLDTAREPGSRDWLKVLAQAG
jgi:ubiquinone/menaquinone biosynthesis C-methylase UbiE